MSPAKTPKFLQSLYDILHNEDAAILAWSVDGSCFQVFDIPRLENEVLPKYFKHGKFTSLQRQLNNFGFRKWTKTRASVCTFSHDVLRRCDPLDLLDMIANTAGATAVFATTALGVGEKRPRSDSTATVVSDLAPHPVSKKPRMSLTEESLYDLLFEPFSAFEMLTDCVEFEPVMLGDLDVDEHLKLEWTATDAFEASELEMLTDSDVLLLLGDAEQGMMNKFAWQGEMSNALNFFPCNVSEALVAAVFEF